MNCKKCNALIPDDSTFCPECGAKVEAAAPSAPAAQVFCANCGAPMASDDGFCQNCGAKAEVVAPVQTAEPKSGKKFDLKSIPQKYMKLGIAAVAVILVLVILISIFSSAGSVNNYALYIKDGEMFYSEMPKGKNPLEVTSRLYSGASNYELSRIANELGAFAHLSADGKRLFYVDKIDDGATLYYRDITNPKKEPVKIASDISDYYTVNEKSTLVTYIKDGNLYQHNLKEQTKIASDVSDFVTSADGKTLVYLVSDDGEGILYKKSGSKDAVKISSDVSEIVYADEKLNTIYFLKGASGGEASAEGAETPLYKKSGNKDPEKIASDVKKIVGNYIYEDGSMYYTVANEDTLTYWDFINDDLQSDSSNDYYRESLKENTADLTLVTLYYYNGKESAKVAENVIGTTGGSKDEPLIAYYSLKDGELPKFKFSTVVEDYYSFNFSDKITEAVKDNAQYALCSKTASAVIALEDIYKIQISPDAKTVYVHTEYDDEGENPDYTTTLNKLTVSGSKIKKTEKVDEDVCVGYSYFRDGVYVYFKDVKDYKGELYMNGKKVDDDAYVYAISYSKESKSLLYFVDWNSDKERGTLKKYNGKKATLVKDDVHDYLFTPKGEVLFLYDYSVDNYRGELWILNGSKTAKLDDDVVAIIPVYSE